MNIFFTEFKAYRKSLIFWCLGMAAMTSAGMSKYSALAATGNAGDEITKSIPKQLQLVMGLGDVNIDKAIGFYAVLFLYLLIIGGIHASLLGADIIAKEERDKTVEFLLAKPVTRSQIITGKFLAALADVMILNIVTFFISVLVVNAFEKGGSDTLAISGLTFALFLFQILFLSLGAFLACVMQKPKRAAALAAAVLLVTFILKVVIDISGNINFLSFLTPFKYFDPASIINGSGYNWFYVILSVVMTLVFTYFAYLFYEKRDMNV